MVNAIAQVRTSTQAQVVMSDLIISELLLFLDPPPSAQGRLSAAPARKKSEKMQAHIQKIASRVHLDVRLASLVFGLISPDPPLRPTVRANIVEYLNIFE